MFTLAGLAGLIVLGLVAGSLGALVGIGGGILIVPVLVLVFGVDIRVAVATSLVAVVATSTAAGSVYVGEGLTNMRLGMALEVATTAGGITGGLVAALIEPRVLSGLFAGVMLVTAALMVRRSADAESAVAESTPTGDRHVAPEPRTGETSGSLRAAYLDRSSGEVVSYAPRRICVGGAVSCVAGIVSGLLGVGGGFLKVPAMTLGMGVPVRAAAATSNFMIGVTAIASLFVYFARGFVHPAIAAPVTVGVVAGAVAGTATAERSSPMLVRIVLGVVLVAVAVQMGLQALGVWVA